MVLDEIGRLRNRDPSVSVRVEQRDDVAGILVSAGCLVIGSDATTTEDRLDALLQHEVGTHLVTWHNDGQQPLRLLGVDFAAAIIENIEGKVNHRRSGPVWSNAFLNTL